ncbi:hypothetical protein CUU66_01595 [Peribacillus deserti]|uniref:Uncharacterized protein n=1 Tax=Peribacillus deserti TaxID=673318 RepID=A0A2N5MB39_9BACI|nr:hypothetical protein CUU66_01595 [Peribacillus deserti]
MNLFNNNKKSSNLLLLMRNGQQTRTAAELLYFKNHFSRKGSEPPEIYSVAAHENLSADYFIYTPVLER